MQSELLVLDANILIRAVLGNKVRGLLEEFSGLVEFLVPDICYNDAQKYLPMLFEKRGMAPEPALQVLAKLECLIQIVENGIYDGYADQAKERIKNRDIHDWPVVATALAFDCAIWTEDQDFFGAGISTWTTDRIHIYFKGS